ncbi:unnamed protein product [Sphagnum balticum]
MPRGDARGVVLPRTEEARTQPCLTQTGLETSPRSYPAIRTNIRRKKTAISLRGLRHPRKASRSTTEDPGTIRRIDKFMVSQGIEERGGRVESAASIRKLSDHSPLTIKIWGLHPPPNNQTRFFYATLLSEENGKAELLQAWSGEVARPSTGRDWAKWLEEATGRVADCNAKMAKEKRRTRGTRVRSCTKIQLAKI